MKYKYPDEHQIKEIIKKHFKKGISQTKLAEEYGFSRQTISKYCRSHGVSPLKNVLNGGGWNKIDTDDKEIARMYVEDQLTINTIADELNYNFTVIASRLKKQGIKLRPNKLTEAHLKIPRYLYHLNRWRYAVMNRDNFVCRWCGTDGEAGKNILETHHIIPRRNVSIEDTTLLFSVDNGITLCHQCHLKIRWREKSFEKFLRNLIMPIGSV